MRDVLDILAAWQALGSGESAALATVVRVEGSSYRLPGARMLIDSAGRRTGSVSGGCLEADIARRARLLCDAHCTELVRYDVNDDDFHLGCNGSVEIFLQRVTPDSSPLRFVQACVLGRAAGAMLTVFRADPDTGIAPGFHLAHSDETESQNPLHLAMFRDLKNSLRSGQTSTITYRSAAGEIIALLEFIAPPLPLVIFGAGDDALPLVELAKSLGWHVTIADRRASYARSERFPGADRIAHPQQVTITADTVTVVKAHHYPDDAAMLRLLLESPARYIGMLGPRSRTDRMIAEFSHFHPTPQQLARLHAPVGLDLGATDPREIAIAVIAEILSVIHDRTASGLRDRSTSIHLPPTSLTVWVPEFAEKPVPV